jgi:hypothetical protein
MGIGEESKVLRSKVEGQKRSRIFIRELKRLTGRVTHLAGHLFNPGRAMRPRSADTPLLLNLDS